MHVQLLKIRRFTGLNIKFMPHWNIAIIDMSAQPLALNIFVFIRTLCRYDSIHKYCKKNRICSRLCWRFLYMFHKDSMRSIPAIRRNINKTYYVCQRLHQNDSRQYIYEYARHDHRTQHRKGSYELSTRTSVIRPDSMYSVVVTFPCTGRRFRVANK